MHSAPPGEGVPPWRASGRCHDEMRRPHVGSQVRWIVLLAMTASLALGAPAARAARLVEKEFEESEAHVINPDCGWVAYNYEDSYELRRQVAGGSEPFAAASVIYTRHPRAAWQGEDGSFESSAPLRLLEDWIAHGRNVAFRVYANSPDDLPEELRVDPDSWDDMAEDELEEADPPDDLPEEPQAESTVFAYRTEKGDGQLIRYWNGAYLADHERLIRFLGKRIGQSPYLAYVDIGGVGNTGGEWFFTPKEAFRQAGFDEDSYYQLVQFMVALYEEAFPGKQLFISYDCVTSAGDRRSDVIALLREHRIGIRDDNLGGWPYPRQDTNLFAWPVPAFRHEAPIAFEGGGTESVPEGGVYGWKPQGKEPAAVLRWALRQAQPTYINLGNSETTSQKACDELPELLERYGKRLGYRLVLLEAACPAELLRGRRYEVVTRWANRGEARCFADRAIEVALIDQAGRTAAALVCPPDPRTTRWRPGGEFEVRIPFSPPRALEPGPYELRVSMILDSEGDSVRRVQIGTKGADEDGRYLVGTVQIVR